MDNNNNRIMTFITSILIIFTILTVIEAYGFDSATGSCDPRTTRRARAQIISSIPCDLSQQGYCNLPGSLYPWHAVRRFVTENQGLMKRMYGDLRHISVLKTEIDNNQIEIDDIENAAERYSHKAQRKAKFLRAEYQVHKNNEVMSEPYFRPTTSSSTTSSTTIKTTLTQSTSPPPTTTITTSTIKTTEVPSTTKTIDTTKISTSSSILLPSTISTTEKIENSVIEKIEREAEILEELIDASIEKNSIILNFTENRENNIQIVAPPNLSKNQSIDETTTAHQLSTTLKKIASTMYEDSTTKSLPTTDAIVSTNNIEKNFEITTETENEAEVTIEDDEIVAESNKFENFVQKQENLGEREENITENYELNKPIPPTSNPQLEAQLYQDTIQKDASPTINFRGKGINACPIKEEVVAPFWANNTRGEVLALLNLYPFEQYVHWEKCTNEHKQMYCRDGCRCEQQYSLHRLLAYDPNNDCRGIFSDWFRFPSCCVCKCYNIPGVEFRGTSRSPRSVDHVKHIADAAEEKLRHAIYDHATEDWYRPRDDYNNYDY